MMQNVRKFANGVIVIVEQLQSLLEQALLQALRECATLSDGLLCVYSVLREYEISPRCVI